MNLLKVEDLDETICSMSDDDDDDDVMNENDADCNDYHFWSDRRMKIYRETAKEIEKMNDVVNDDEIETNRPMSMKEKMDEVVFDPMTMMMKTDGDENDVTEI